MGNFGITSVKKDFCQNYLTEQPGKLVKFFEEMKNLDFFWKF